MNNENYRECELSEGTYVLEKRIGYWMVWAPNEDQSFFVDPSYELCHLMMKAKSKERQQ